MKSAGTNKFKERKLAVSIRIEDLEKNLADSRFGFKMGTTRQLCEQFGVSVSTSGKRALLSSTRDKLQMVVGILYYCNVKYSTVA